MQRNLPQAVARSNRPVYRSYSSSSSSLGGWTQQGPKTLCPLCRKLDCKLSSHRRFLEQIRSQDFRKHDLSTLLSSSFAYSYSFNPLTVAVDYVCGQLQDDMDASELGGHSSLSSALNKLISYDIGRNTPFTDPTGNTLGEVAADWLVATSVDELACTSTLNLWLMIEWTNTKKQSLERRSSKLTSLFLELLRKRVESQEPVSSGTVFAASNHLAICLIFFDQTNAQRAVMMNGLEALVNAKGGFEKIASENDPGLFQSLLWSDVMFSCFTGSRPRFNVKSPPPMPPSLVPERSATFEVPVVYLNCCSPDLLHTARYLRFFLLFRHGSEIRPLDKGEYQYMVTLERYIHCQLLNQSAQYHETTTMNECMAVALSVVRMTVLCVWEQHVQIRRMLGGRLERAIKDVGVDPWLEADAEHALIWVCWVMLAQSEPCQDQIGVTQILVSALRSVMGDNFEDWPMQWGQNFNTCFEPLLWHLEYDTWISHVVDLVEDFIANE